MALASIHGIRLPINLIGLIENRLVNGIRSGNLIAAQIASSRHEIEQAPHGGDSIAADADAARSGAVESRLSRRELLRLDRRHIESGLRH